MSGGDPIVINADEEVIRKRGRKVTPKISPKKSMKASLKKRITIVMDNAVDDSNEVTPQSSADNQKHTYNLRTPKKSQTSANACVSDGVESVASTSSASGVALSSARTPSKVTPSKVRSLAGDESMTPTPITRSTPRKRLLMSSNDSGIEMTPQLRSPPKKVKKCSPANSLKRSLRLYVTQN
jgi:hypothetical protein